MSKIKKIMAIVITLASSAVVLVGCGSQADKVSHNLSQEADNFNAVRQLTVINGITDEIIFQMSGRISIEVDSVDSQLEIIVEEEDGVYKKHFVGISDNVTYVVEDISSDVEVDNYQYELNFNPKMLWPVQIETID